MKTRPFGEVVSEHVKLTNDFKVWVQEEISDWADHQPEDKDNADFHYFLNVKRLRKQMNQPVQFQCDLQLLTRNHILDSNRSGKSPKRALRHCLESFHAAA
ncbi:MAG: hypothetical protein A2583_14025 [Bdellovibrionales bacterium RIFOXYD1_FULL_53_11]|nr:MAG: hypothetical protein A2583_14025 [Bdellovibrionales bacterium RIFOXYD1_FULL_53_11]